VLNILSRGATTNAEPLRSFDIDEVTNRDGPLIDFVTWFLLFARLNCLMKAAAGARFKMLCAVLKAGAQDLETGCAGFAFRPSAIRRQGRVIETPKTWGNNNYE
jgi:hypothetical protein